MTGLKRFSATFMLAALSAAALPQPAAALPPAAPATVALPANAQQVLHPALAYVRTPDSQLNALAAQGLRALADAVTAKTSYEPHDVIAVDIENDDISLLPFLYWPVSEQAAPLSQKAQDKVQAYINNGGMILFDLNNVNEPAGSMKALYRMLGHVQLRPLETMKPEHTLTHSFYKIADLRGTYNYSDVRVNERGPRGAENVSAVIIGENDWAGAWAGLTLPKGSRDQEMALRSGINMVVYALTGNYKDDQMDIIPTLQKMDR